jgi:hypothetical protein
MEILEKQAGEWCEQGVAPFGPGSITLLRRIAVEDSSLMVLNSAVKRSQTAFACG